MSTKNAPHNSLPVQDIDALFQPNHDERARQRLISAMRNYATVTLRDGLRTYYTDVVQPRAAAKGVELRTPRDIAAAMTPDATYRFYSTIRYNAQEMVYQSVIPAVERALPALNAAAREIANTAPAGGSLRLAPALPIPNYVTALDIHLVPGCFHAEHTSDDVAQGVILAQGGRVSTGANLQRKDDTGGVGRSVGTWLARRDANFKPRRILDIGTQSGKNLLPYLDIFPEAEAYGVDVSAPGLRYGHAKAEYAGKAIHFSQQNAEAMDFPDGYFDLIVSSFFFHEVPLGITRRILAESHRLLASKAVMAHMELPPHKLCDPWLNFSWDWDTKNNNEPNYTRFRAQDPHALCVEAGFAADACFELTVPNVSTFPPDEYAKFLRGEISAPRHGRGGWFIFGATRT